MSTGQNECGFRQCTDLLPIGIVLLSADGAIREINPAGQKLVEAVSPDQLRGKPFQHIVAPEFRSAFLSVLKDVIGGRSDSLEFQVTGLQGTRRWLETRIVTFPAEGGGESSALLSCSDISERVQREGRNRYLQKMDTIATLAGGVAHDLNNILTTIVGYANILKLKLGSDEYLQACAEKILATTDRATNLTRSLLSFGSKQILNLAPVAFDELMTRLAKAVAAEAGTAVQVRADGTPPEGIVLMADEGQLQHAFRQLARNARDAMPQGGVIALNGTVMEMEDTFISIHGYGMKGNYAVISLVDSGSGMDEQTRRKAFEPFFSTKEAGRGLGLGLAIVYGIIKSHRGFVNIYSEPEIGTTVRVYLPATGITRSSHPDDDLVPEGRGETILFAEDDADYRTVMSSLLEEFGYTVLQASDGAEAIALAGQAPRDIQLALLDAAMPARNGREVAEELGRIMPATRVLFLSGLPPDIVKSRGLVRDSDPCLTKPVSPRDLLRAIREVLRS